MLRAQIEDYRNCVSELRAIYPRHWAELNPAPDIPLDPDYHRYWQIADTGNMLFATLRTPEGDLAGYFIGFIFPELHYKTVLACTEDIFYVVPEHRNQWGGVKLFRCIERELRRRGITRWYVTTKLHKDSGALLRRLGFAAVETLYSKRMDKPWAELSAE